MDKRIKKILKVNNRLRLIRIQRNRKSGSRSQKLVHLYPQSPCHKKQIRDMILKKSCKCRIWSWSPDSRASIQAYHGLQISSNTGAHARCQGWGSGYFTWIRIRVWPEKPDSNSLSILLIIFRQFFFAIVTSKQTHLKVFFQQI